ncbi:unnamed protein product [Mytilus coruscus]|uniref:Uncharacterized protein n=1 Tax=Mytilus coruscus TaxID=42192 RepID=A0A6J8CNU1_MYTCO|nr:unnamed protein product [Mytilus coruscus]
MSPNKLQSRQVHRKKYRTDKKSNVTTKKMKIDESQMTDSPYNMAISNTETKVLSKAEKERIRYKTDDEFKARKTDELKRKYWENKGIRSKKICSGIEKYEENETYRKNMIQAGIQKYKADEDYRNDLIQAGIQKYKEDHEYREKLKQASVQNTSPSKNHAKGDILRFSESVENLLGERASDLLINAIALSKSSSETSQSFFDGHFNSRARREKYDTICDG